jgi:serine/threonine protein kinase
MVLANDVCKIGDLGIAKVCARVRTARVPLNGPSCAHMTSVFCCTAACAGFDSLDSLCPRLPHLSQLLKHTMAAKTQIGTPHYMPPEIWKNK